MSGRDEERDASYSEFVTTCHPRLRRIAHAVCRDRDRAEDVLQDALVKLYLAWPRVAGTGREEAYARRVIVNADIDDRRRLWRRPRAPLEEAGQLASPDAPGAVVEERSALLAALRRLPAMQRRTVVLRHYVGLSVEETADELGIATGTVKSHCHRALAALQADLAEEPDVVLTPPGSDRPPR